MRRRWTVLVLAVAACTPAGMNRQDVHQALRSRVGAGLRPQTDDREPGVPPRVQLADGLTPAEAVAVALWNNPTFQSELARVDLSRADLEEAGLLPNLWLSLVFPLGPRQFALTATWPLSELWQRPRRLRAAELDLARVATGLVQSGLDLAQNARLAHVDVRAAQHRIERLREAHAVAQELARLTAVRVGAGDAPAAEGAIAEADAHNLRGRLAQAVGDEAAARARMQQLLGLGELPTLADEPLADSAEDVSAVVTRALAARPDVRAAELAVEAATARLGWERSRAWSLLGMLDGGTNLGQGTGFAPGVRGDIPLFSRNQGGIGRAEAEVERASWTYVAARQTVVAEVQTAVAQRDAAREALRANAEGEGPAAERALTEARASLEAGEIAPPVALEAQRRVVDLALRRIDLEADLQRAEVRLWRAAGGTWHATR